MNSYPSWPAMLCRSALKFIPSSVTGVVWKNLAGGSGPPNTVSTRSRARGPWTW